VIDGALSNFDTLFLFLAFRLNPNMQEAFRGYWRAWTLSKVRLFLFFK
jgi:hypothetical protein